MLAESYGWFTEEFYMKDLIARRAGVRPRGQMALSIVLIAFTLMSVDICSGETTRTA